MNFKDEKINNSVNHEREHSEANNNNSLTESGHPTVELNQSTPTKQLPVPVNKENSNSSLGSPFIKAPFWAKTVNTSSKRNKEKVPAVVTSRELKNYFHKKEEEKRLKQTEIEQRKKERELRN